VGSGREERPGIETVVRAGWGIFYDRFSENYVLQALRQNGYTQQTYQAHCGRRNSAAAIQSERHSGFAAGIDREDAEHPHDRSERAAPY